MRATRSITAFTACLLAFAANAAPESDTDRIARHLASVEADLRAADVSHLTPSQAAARATALDHLHDYWNAGVFPHNHARVARNPVQRVDGMFRPDDPGRAPVFVDEHGTHCAVGHLMLVTGHGDIAQSVRDTANYAYVYELADPALDGWAHEYGFSRTELSTIQPAYGWYDSDLDGLTDGDELIVGTDPYDPDTDHDSIPDGHEVFLPWSPQDTDADGVIDALDVDDDGDGLLTLVEGREDRDCNRYGTPIGDGVPAYLDLDSDGDDIFDGDEPGDADADGVPDFLVCDIENPFTVQATTEVVGGTTVTFQAEGAVGGATVVFLRGSNLGEGPCPDLLGGGCLTINDPKLLGPAVADATGVASIEVSLPAAAMGLTMAVQAVVADGADSQVSHALEVPVL